jgi:hypothetical protein
LNDELDRAMLSKRTNNEDEDFNSPTTDKSDQSIKLRNKKQKNVNKIDLVDKSNKTSMSN